MGKPRKWTREACEKESRKYETRYDFQMACSQGYAVSKKNGWLEEFYWLPSKPRPKKWTKELCEAEAHKYSKWIDFKTNASSAFYAAERYGWLKDFTWLEHSQKPNGYWTETRCYEEALKYTNPTDFKNANSTAYATASTNRWLKNYTWFEKKPNPNKKWDEDTCRLEALKYESKKAFSEGNKSAYAISLRNGWMDAYTWLVECDNRKWTKDACAEVSKQYQNRGQFAIKSPNAYEASRRNGWLDEFVWLRDERLDLLKDKIDSVYSYEFVEFKAVYVGRTLMKRQRCRDMEHIFNDDAVSLFAKEHDISVPSMKILETDLTIEEGSIHEGVWVEKYKQEGWKILNRAKTGSLGGLNKSRCKYNREVCYSIASECTYPAEYKKKNPSAYNVSRKNGWLKDYTWFQDGNKISADKRRKFNEDSCRTEALKFKTKKDFRKYAKTAYNTAIVKGWIDEYIWLKEEKLVKGIKNTTSFSKKDKTQSKELIQINLNDDSITETGYVKSRDQKCLVRWTKEAVEAEARKYKTVKEWRLNSSGSYSTAIHNGWRKEFDWFEKPKPVNVKWTEAACRESAEKCKTLKQYREEYASSYNAALKNGWVSDYTWLEKANDIQVKEWTREMCEAESKKYTSRSAFYKGCSSAYHKSRIEGWLDDFVWLEPQRHEKDYWTEARCEEVARSYKRMYDFQTANLGAYNAAKRNGWLKNYTWLEMVYPNMKPRGYWDDYQHCYDEAKRHTEYKSFVRKSGGAYNSALAHGWLKDYTWLQGGNRGWKKGKNNKTDVTE